MTSQMILCRLNCAFCRLKAVACTGCLDLQLVDSSALVDVFLPRLLPRFWQGQALVSWNAGADGAPTADWIALLWQQLQVCSFSGSPDA